MSAANDTEITFLTAVVCDDLRREDSGKELLIGVYSGDIIVQSFPQPLALCFWIPVEVKSAGKTALRFRIRNTDGDVVNETSLITVDFPKSDMDASIALGQIPILIPKAGPIVLEGAQNDGPWREIKSISVQRGP